MEIKTFWPFFCKSCIYLYRSCLIVRCTLFLYWPYQNSFFLRRFLAIGGFCLGIRCVLVTCLKLQTVLQHCTKRSSRWRNGLRCIFRLLLFQLSVHIILCKNILVEGSGKMVEYIVFVYNSTEILWGCTAGGSVWWLVLFCLLCGDCQVQVICRLNWTTK